MIFFIKKKFLLLGILFMVLMSVILNLIPAEYVPKLGLGEFRLHLFNYATLTIFLTVFLLVHNKNRGKFFIIIISGVFVLLFSSAIEFFQLFVPHRSFELVDIAVNCLGVFMGLICSLIIFKLYSKLKPQNQKIN